jgi:hypothetical protein
MLDLECRLSRVKQTQPPAGLSSESDPDVWSGRALQEDFVELAVAVLHQCIRPLIGACCAPGHHGYQRACVLISGQASIGPSGSPVFARARKTDPPFCLILSQTSAGSC